MQKKATTTIAVQVRMAPEQYERLVAQAGLRNISSYVRDAIEKKIARELTRARMHAKNSA